MKKENSSGNKKARMNIYSNLTAKRREKKDSRARKKAEHLASLPKHPVKRFFYRLHPKRVAKYWFSRQGGIMALKIFGIGILVIAVLVAALFAYYRKDLDAIRPEELDKRVQTTVITYLDRNGKKLWEDKGTGDYKIVVKFDEINKYMKDATIAIEDKDFYQHGGISISGTLRSFFNNVSSGSTQGGSTLTQQLVKTVFLSDEAQLRSGLAGYNRKIKEAILSIEVERMYSKDQILGLYLNEVPYGGRRNGVESAARTYFGIAAKDLSLAQASLLAAVPQSPGRFNPYNAEGNEDLIARQHVVLDNMATQKYITRDEAEAAKKEYPDSATLQSKIKPAVDEASGITAPHFVLEVKKQLEKEFGTNVMGRGGLTIKTTLDLDAQGYAEKAVVNGAKLLRSTGGDNISMTSVDVATGQVIAQIGSVDYSKAEYGQQNAAVSPLEPGSSIKPLADFATLFKEREGVNYGPGSILRDEDVSSFYCGGTCKVNNYTGKTYGDVTIRQSLASSLNRTAIKALYIAGIANGVQTAKDLGDLSLCSDNPSPGLSISIGGGCTVHQDEHTNSYATLARGGVYKPLAYVLEVKNSEGQVLKQWKDESKQAVDPQVAYMLSSILSDTSARSLVFGSQATSFGFVIPGVWTASKTGTTDNGDGLAKDSWIMGYSPVVATGVWSGNHDGRPLSSSENTVVRRVINDYMEPVHKNIYAAKGVWKTGDQVTQPAGMQKLTVRGKTDIWPSWYKKVTDADGVKTVFDSVSKKKATDCTPARAKVELIVQKIEDPITKKTTLSAPDGYDANAEDDAHNCADIKPVLSDIVQVSKSGATYTMRVSVIAGGAPLQSVSATVNGADVGSLTQNGNTYTFTFTATSTSATVAAMVIDQKLYDSALTKQFTTSLSTNGKNLNTSPVAVNEQRRSSLSSVAFVSRR